MNGRDAPSEDKGRHPEGAVIGAERDGGADREAVRAFLATLAETLDVDETLRRLSMTADQARSILASLIAVQGHGAAGPEPGDRPGRSVPAASTAVEATINVDGASRGNPGKAGLGVIIREEPGGRVVRKISRYLGETTNNVAEYSALIAALEAARELGLRRIRVLADSELMVRQIKGLYKVRNEGLRPLHARAAALIKSFDRFEIRHVPRGRNSEADAMANAAIDARK